MSSNITYEARPDRNLALELARVTEFAAMGAAAWIGRGDKNAADQAAVDALHYVLGSTPISGIVVSGEGTKDEAPKLAHGEEIGAGGPRSTSRSTHSREPASPPRDSQVRSP